jgi:hypothetical protein
MMTSTALNKFSVSLAGAALLLIGTALTETSSAKAAIINGDFNSGLNNWSTAGSVITANGQAVLEATGSEDEASAESFLGLAPGSLAAINVNPTNGSFMKQAFFANAGSIVSFDWEFNANDYLPFNDFAFYSLTSANLLSDVQAVGNYGSSGPRSTSFTIATSGLYTLGFGVFNSVDQALSLTTLSIDNVSVTGDAIPTPALLPGLIGLGFGVLRKRKGQAA